MWVDGMVFKECIWLVSYKEKVGSGIIANLRLRGWK